MSMTRRFTILTHDHPYLHWDFLVENGETLLAWRLLEEPDSMNPFAVEPLPDHRTLYLDYEGPVSRNRGNVAQWDTGICEMTESPEFGFTFELEGKRLKGRLRLEWVEGESRWICYPPGSSSGSD